MNPRIAGLATYPFERLAALKAGITPPEGFAPIPMSIGEPQHVPPRVVLDALRDASGQPDGNLGNYPATAGLPELRSACARWLERRDGLVPGSLDPQSMVLPVNGTREGLFAFIQAAVDPTREAAVVMPDPGYPIYAGATLLAGAQPHYYPLTAAQGFEPDLAAVPASIWRRCQVLMLCSPGNPTGRALGERLLGEALALADRHDFIVAADECYAELYNRAPSTGLLASAQRTGRERFARCVVFHSLSKRSSVPGLRSGFAAGDPQLIAPLLRYRTFHGCAMPVPTQLASIAAWSDDAHAAVNRALYREKFERVIGLLGPLLPVTLPDGAFYLWVDVGGDDERFARELCAKQNVTVLPGRYLSSSSSGSSAGSAAAPGAAPDPGSGYVRISLTPPLEVCIEAAQRIAGFVAQDWNPCR